MADTIEALRKGEPLRTLLARLVYMLACIFACVVGLLLVGRFGYHKITDGLGAYPNNYWEMLLGAFIVLIGLIIGFFIWYFGSELSDDIVCCTRPVYFTKSWWVRKLSRT